MTTVPPTSTMRIATAASASPRVGSRRRRSAGRFEISASSAGDNARPMRARDEAADFGERADRGPMPGPLDVVHGGFHLRAHRPGGKRRTRELARGRLLDALLR